MINYDKLHQVLAAYRRDFYKNIYGDKNTRWEDEQYKWIAVKHFKDHWDIDAPDFASMFMEATAKHANLLVSMNFFPRGMIKELANAEPEGVRSMFKYLYNEDLSVVDRVNHFIVEAERIRSTYGTDKWKSHYQNINSVSTYLWSMYPDKYYIYKYSECKKAADVLESNIKIKKGATAEALLDFYAFYDEITAYLAEDKETIEVLHSALTPACYPDPSYHTLTIDVGFYISRTYESSGSENTLAEKPSPEYWPSPEEDPVHITKEEWKKYIEEIEIPNHIGCVRMLKGMMLLGGEASCKKLSDVYGGSANKYNGFAMNIGRRAKKFFNISPYKYGDSESLTSIPFQGRVVSNDEKKFYSFKIRDELLEALNDIDLSDIDPHFVFEVSDEINYWWLNANPKIWSFSNLAIGEVQSYTLYNENGNKRRIFQNFLDAKAGDLVIGYESYPVKQVVALAKISKGQDGKELIFEKTEGLSNPIDYQVLKDCPELAEMEYFNQPQGSLFKLTKDEYDFIMDIIRDNNPNLANADNLEKYTRENFLQEVYMEDSQYDSLVSLLRNKYNLILQGVPGVGKTFAAKRLAYSMMGVKDDSRIEFVQFHQNYSYEDFMMGYKPTDNGFELKYGIFYQFCMLAANHPDKEYFFIIDEINRGNMSKIFGELLMLIEKDYRNKRITLAYNGMSFSVPANVYIIGMMNTADRSLAMIDYALRRRFSFYTMMPGFDTKGFKEYQISLKNPKLDKLVDELKSLNRTITNDKSLGAGFCIGHSYFCGHHAEDQDTWLQEVVNYDIIPMLNEYWFDSPDNVDTWSSRLNGVLNG